MKYKKKLKNNFYRYKKNKLKKLTLILEFIYGKSYQNLASFWMPKLFNGTAYQ